MQHPPRPWLSALYLSALPLSALAVICGGLLACTGTEVGNPQDDETEIELRTQGLDRSVPGGLVLENGVELVEAWMVFEEIEFRSGRECEVVYPVGDATINAVELISGEEFPGYDLAVVPAQSYCRFTLELTPVAAADLPAGVPQELEGLSLLIRGNTPEGVPFEVHYEEDETIDLHGRFTLSPGSESLFTVFAMDRWISPRQSRADQDGEETILIDDETTPDLLEEIVEGILESGLLVRDADQDGALTDQELRVPLARGDAQRIGVE